MGAVATTPIRVGFDGDASLRKRPMKRVLEPFSRFGTSVSPEGGDRLPVTLAGARSPFPITYEMQVPSAQVKSAMLLAALNVPGRTTIVERAPRAITPNACCARSARRCRSWPAAIAIEGEAELTPREIVVPGDPSSAAFPLPPR